MGKEGARWSGPFFTLPEKKKRKMHKRASKAPAPLAPLCPTAAPPVAESLAQASLTPALSPLPTDRMDSFPPDLVTLSQVEDLVAMHEMIQALHARTPPPALSPSSTAMELDAGPVLPPPPLPPSSPLDWVSRHPAPDNGTWCSWLTDALENDISVTLPRVLRADLA